MKTFITIEREAECEFTFRRGHRGHRDRYGAPEEPDEPDELEFTGATVDGKPVDLTEAEIERATQLAYEELDGGG